MANVYDDSKYGVMERLWLTAQQVNQSDVQLSGDSTLVKRFYPKGPIKILRFGVQHLATQGGTEVTVSLKKGASGTVWATVVASTDSAPWVIASKTPSTTVIPAGSYITVDSAGTVATGSVHCFIDYVRTFSSSWDV